MNDERYKQLMNDVGLPNSLSLLTALRQVENEVSQPLLAENERLRAFAASIFTTDDWDYDDWCRKARAALEQKP